MLQAYREHVAERAKLGIPPLALDAKQVADVIELIKNPPAGEEAFLLDLLTHRVPPGVDDAAKVKASFLAAVAHGDIQVGLISKAKATELLGTMVGGYNVHPLIELLDDAEVAQVAADALKKTLLMFDYFNDVADKAKAGNAKAKEVMQSWADAEWFTSRPKVAEKITVTVFKVPGETNTDDLSPAPDATTRPDIPMHYLAMLKNARPDAAFKPEQDGVRGPIQFIEDLKKKGHTVAYVGDVVGTGSSRKSATNSVIWATGEDIPFVPNKRFGGVTLGGKIAPIFFNTQEDSGSLPIEVDVSKMEMGDVIDIFPYEGKIEKDGTKIADFQLKSQVLLDEVQAGGRINLIIGLITPPVGSVLFVASAVSNQKMETVTRAMAPFFVALFSVLMVVTYVPQISLWLPRVTGELNYPPDVVDDVATTTKGQPVTIDALKNDSDEEKDPLTITKVVVLEGQGEAMVNADGAVLFTPAAEFSGKAVIEYIANDFRGGPEKAKITVTVTP